MQIKIDVLRALTGFRQARGGSEDAAASWARANLSRATALAQSAADADPHGDPMSVRQAALRALRDLAASG